MTKEDILKGCTVEGNIVKLPPQQLDRKLYCAVAKVLNLIGGKWKGGKTAGFVFQENPTRLLSFIARGVKKNPKKEFQFFATPERLAHRLVEMAELQCIHSVLEPSAGQGAIIAAINKKYPKTKVFCYELMDINVTFLRKIPTAIIIGNDFLDSDECDPIDFDRIIANPPFSKNQDIDHILEMFLRLKPGGILVSVASRHWLTSTNKKEKDFSEWLAFVGAEMEDIDAGEFKKSGTAVGGTIIKITKKP